MNTLEITSNTPVYEQDGVLYFDLLDIATNLGYSRPDKAVNDFISTMRKTYPDGETFSKINEFTRSAKKLPKNWRAAPILNELYPESVLYYFLGYSNMPAAKEWRRHIYEEVLPLVRQVGMKAIKQVKASQLASTERQSPELLEELENLLGKEEAHQFCEDNNYYRLLGYLPPSEIKPSGWSLLEFWNAIDLDASDTYYCKKFHNSFREDGKWYAFKEAVYLDRAVQIDYTNLERPDVDFPKS